MILQRLSKQLYEQCQKLELPYFKQIYFVNENRSQDCIKSGVHQKGSQFYLFIETNLRKTSTLKPFFIDINSQHEVSCQISDHTQRIVGKLESQDFMELQKMIVSFLIEKTQKPTCTLEKFKFYLEDKSISHQQRLHQLSEFLNSEPKDERIWIEKKLMSYLKKKRKISEKSDLFEYVKETKYGQIVFFLYL